MGFADHPVKFFTPFTVLGPVLSPPCKRQRPLLYRSRRLQGVPARVFAPHTKSLHIFGIDNPYPALHHALQTARALSLCSRLKTKDFWEICVWQYMLPGTGRLRHCCPANVIALHLIWLLHKEWTALLQINRLFCGNHGTLLNYYIPKISSKFVRTCTSFLLVFFPTISFDDIVRGFQLQ